MYEYKCKILKVVDGDTVDVDIDLGFGVWLKNERVRIMGIDTPESRTRDNVEKAFGLLSKNRLSELLPKSSVQLLKTFKDRGTGEDAKGKFGRILGDFIVEHNGQSSLVTSVLVEEAHAVAYHGENKELVQEQHMKNREILRNKGLVK
jgi:micrococcal nuclease